MSSRIRLPPLVRDQTDGPHLQFSPICARKRSNRQLTIPLNPINSNMLDMDAEVFLTGVMPGLYGQCMSLLTKLRKLLGGDWVLGGDRGQPGVKNAFEAEAEVERLSPWREKDWIGAVVAAGPIALREKVSKLLDDTPFIPRVPNTYFESLHHMLGAPTEKNMAHPRKLYRQMVATNRLLRIAKSLFRRQRGLPMGFEAITYARPTILKNYTGDVDEAFQSLPPRNTYGSDDPAIEKGPGVIIPPCTNHEQCPIFVSGPTDGPNANTTAASHSAVRAPAIRRDSRRIHPKTTSTASTHKSHSVVASKSTHSVTTLQLQSSPPTHHLSLIKCRGHVIHDVCTLPDSIKRWVTPKSSRKPEFRDVRKSGWGDLWALRAKSRTRRNIKIGDGNKKVKSKLIAIMDPHGDGARAIIRGKTTAFLKARRKEATKVARL
ncbi:hypothetical protein HOY80DRAFT_1094645 [Tuber brumale]|nr:hypothetical protein HOY80DRAFT_1094645 [Tuber brumale]